MQFISKAVLSILCWLLSAACVPNQPAIQTVNPEAESARPGARASSAPIVGVQTGQPTPTLIANISEIDQAEMVYVYAGTFTMGGRILTGGGQSQGRNLDEVPRHEVYLDAFWIDKTEVTNRMYSLCVRAGNCTTPDPPPTFATASFYYGSATYLDYPVVNVTWFDAKDYCEWAGRRLPTEAEWEKAAKGTSTRIYPWGYDEPSGQLVNVCDRSCLIDRTDAADGGNSLFNDGHAEVAPADSFPRGASPYGALHLAGNVFEWVFDWYGEDYYSESPNENPMGPSTGKDRVMRGGSWYNSARVTRAANRESNEPTIRWNALGFRCAMDAQVY